MNLTFFIYEIRLMASSYGDQMPASKSILPNELAKSLTHFNTLVVASNYVRNNWSFTTADTNSAGAMDEAVKALNQQLAGSSIVYTGSSASGGYTPIYDPNNNPIGHVSTALFTQNGNPIGGSLSSGGNTLRLYGCATINIVGRP